MRRLLGLTLLLLLPPTALGEPKVDRYGDALPEGAVLRLGTQRFAVSARYVAFSRDGKRLLAWGDHNGQTRLFDARTGKILCDFPGSRVAALSPDGNCVALFNYEKKSKQNIFRLYDAGTGKQQRQNVVPFGNPVFSPDGRTLAIGTWRGAPTSWDVASGKKMWASTKSMFGPYQYNDFLRQFTYSSDGKYLIGTDFDRLAVWNARDGEQLHKPDARWRNKIGVSPEGRRPGDYKFWVSPDGHFAGHFMDNRVAVRTVPEMKLVREWPAGRGWSGSGGGYVWSRYVSAIAFSPDSRRIAWAGRDGTITVAEMKTGKVRHTFKTTGYFIYQLIFSPDGRKLTSADRQGVIRVWDVATGKSLNVGESHHGNIGALAVSSDGRTIATASTDKTIRLWDAATGQQRRRLIGAGEILAFSQDGSTLAAASYVDAKVDIWNLSTGKKVRKLTHNRSAIVHPAFARKNRLYTFHFTFGEFGKKPKSYHLHGWDIATGKALNLPDRTKEAAGSNESLVDFSPDGQFLAHADATQRQFSLVHCARNQKLARLGAVAADGDTSPHVAAVRFAPEGRHLASLHRNGVIQIWDAVSHDKVQTLKGHPLTYESGLLAFSLDGRYLLAATEENDNHGNEDWQVRLWDWPSGQVVWERDMAFVHLAALAFVAPGNRFVTMEGSYNEQPFALVWSLAPPNLPKLSLEKHWQRLGSTDGKDFYASMWALASQPTETLPFLKRRLKPAQGVPDKEFARLLADLDAPRYAIRAKATVALRSMGTVIEGRLTQTLQSEKLTLEVHLRVQRLLEELRRPILSPEELRQMRALTLLEWTGNDEARQLLEKLAAGTEHARFTQHARRAFQRMIGSAALPRDRVGRRQNPRADH